MKFTKKIQKAIEVAAMLHDGQKRRERLLPYILHPFSVAVILSEYTNDEDVIIAGLLHDTIEDCGYTPKTLEKEFGNRVKRIVIEVTEDVVLKKQLGEKRSWRRRKEKYLAHLKKVSREGLLVAAADRLHNFISYIDGYRTLGKKIHRRFNAKPRDYEWFYGELMAILKKRLKSPIVRRLQSVYQKVRNILRKLQP